MKNSSNEQIAMKVSAVSILWNVILSFFKLFAGIFAHSGAMISDAIHSASDVLSTFIVIIGVKIANRESDDSHPYGHERMECVAAIILAVILFITGLGIGYKGILIIMGGDYSHLTVPGLLALIAAVISILIKEGMFWYTRSAAKKIDSGALMADAWHHRSDALSSVGSFAGILGARMGYPILDPIASVIICGFILKAAFEIFMDSINKMTDAACDEEVIKEIKNIILNQKGVIKIDQLKTRLFGDKIYVDVEIQVNGDISLREAHDIAHNVHDSIEKYIPKVKHCMVHVNPKEDKKNGELN